MKKVLHHAIVEMGIFDYILFGQANKAFAFDLLPKGVQTQCSKSFFYKCLAIRAGNLLQDKEQYLSAAERYFNKATEMSDPASGAPRLCVQLFTKYLENHSDDRIRMLIGLKPR